MSEDDRHGEPRIRFDALVQQYSRMIRSVVVRVAGTRARQHADDIEQDILLALWKQVRQGRAIAHPTSYLYRAAVRETVRVMRSLHRGGAVSLDDIDLPPSTLPSPLESLQRDATTTRLRQALDALPQDRRRAVEAHLAGMSADEIMSVTGWSYNRTRNLISRAMADLRQRLESADPDG